MKTDHYPNLFDPPREVNIPLSNKIESYYSDDTKRKRVTQKDKIYQVLVRSRDLLTQREISEETGIPRHLVPDRLLVLIKENKVVVAGSCIDNLTNRQVSLYKAL